MMGRDEPKQPNPAETARPGLERRYRSMFVIAEGGMGSVEAALDLGASASEEGRTAEPRIERIVALKRLLPGASKDKRRVEMFLREARLATMLEHPNIVRAYDYGEANGELYLAMELVDGEPLSKLLAALKASNASLRLDVVAWLVAEVCRGLHAAHELCDPSTGASLHLVHRDVSPHNIMVSYDGRVRLLDFGVAKIDSGSATKTGEVKGKAAYMSPEQAMGDPLDRRSDLFSLGAVLYECLTLERMWGDGTEMDVIRKLALEAPPRLGADLPATLVALQAALVARDPAARPRAALEIADALSAFVPNPADAARALGATLRAHLGSAADERRQRLEQALGTLAPAQAAALRESVLPSAPRPAPAPPRPTRRKRVMLALASVAAGLAVLAGQATRREPRAALPATHDASQELPAPATSAGSTTSGAMPLPTAAPAATATASSVTVPPKPRRAPGPTRPTGPAQSARPKATDIDETPF